MRNARVSGLNKVPGRSLFFENVDFFFFVDHRADELLRFLHIAAEEHRACGNEDGHLRRMLADVDEVVNETEVKGMALGVARRGKVIPILKTGVGGAEDVPFA